MALSKYEQETTVSYNEAEGVAQVYTASPVDMRKLDKFCEAEGTEWKMIGTETLDGKVVAKKYECPKGLVRGFHQKAVHHNYTDEQKKMYSDRLKAARQKKKEGNGNDIKRKTECNPAGNESTEESLE